MVSDCGAIRHSGDNKDGVKEGYDEVISIDLSRLNFAAQYLCILINSFNGEGFSKVETASVSIFQGSNKLDEVYLGEAGKNNTVLSCILTRTNPLWSFAHITAFGPGKVFTESDDLIMKNLEKVGLDPIILMETKNWNPTSGKKFNIKKEQTVNIPEGLT